MHYTREELCRIWLNSVDGIGTTRFYLLLAEFGSACAVWDNLSDLSATTANRLGRRARQNLKESKDEHLLDRILETMEAHGVYALTTESDRYPESLLDIYDAPPVIYCKGDAPLNYDRRIGIVGSRRATYDGLRAAREIAEHLSLNGVSVVSGMALGIDTEAHTGALKGNTHTIAVLGCGVEIPYPQSNQKLYDQIVDQGGMVISEYPMGTKPVAGNFPRRNRIIAGLSQGVMLVEGAKGSGAMITIDYALEQGRDVFAVPGGIYSPMAAAPNQLIVEGATPVLSGDSILQFYGWTEAAIARPTRAVVELDGDEQLIMTELINEALTFDELTMRTKLPPDELNMLLTMLELRQIIVRLPGNTFKANL